MHQRTTPPTTPHGHDRPSRNGPQGPARRVRTRCRHRADGSRPRRSRTGARRPHRRHPARRQRTAVGLRPPALQRLRPGSRTQRHEHARHPVVRPVRHRRLARRARPGLALRRAARLHLRTGGRLRDGSRRIHRPCAEVRRRGARARHVRGDRLAHADPGRPEREPGPGQDLLHGDGEEVQEPPWVCSTRSPTSPRGELVGHQVVRRADHPGDPGPGPRRGGAGRHARLVVLRGVRGFRRVRGREQPRRRLEHHVHLPLLRGIAPPGVPRHPRPGLRPTARLRHGVRDAELRGRGRERLHHVAALPRPDEAQEDLLDQLELLRRPPLRRRLQDRHLQRRQLDGDRGCSRRPGSGSATASASDRSPPRPGRRPSDAPGRGPPQDRDRARCCHDHHGYARN